MLKVEDRWCSLYKELWTRTSLLCNIFIFSVIVNESGSNKLRKPTDIIPLSITMTVNIGILHNHIVRVKPTLEIQSFFLFLVIENIILKLKIKMLYSDWLILKFKKHR